MRCDAVRGGGRRAQPPRNRRAMPWRGERRHAAYLRRLSSAALRGSCGRAHAAIVTVPPPRAMCGRRRNISSGAPPHKTLTITFKQ
eukprot:scaffold2768_cov314-Prasinococcus_capsulatus_cf.AAC.1